MALAPALLRTRPSLAGGIERMARAGGRMEGYTGSGVARASCALALSVLVCLTSVGARAAAVDDAATNEEWALLVLANQARSDPAAFGYSNPIVPPLIWNDGLARAARAHSDDMATNGCYGHNSCNGQVWWKRVQSYFPDWTGLAENVIAVGDTPEQLHAGWMGSDGHRSNILGGGLVEFGAGIAEGPGPFGQIAFATEDFGTRYLLSLRALPAIPAAAVLPRTGLDAPRRLLANFYDYDGPPLALRALVGSSCVDLALETGAPEHGTYTATQSFPDKGCTPLVFEAIRGNGVRYRFPTDGAILVAAGGADCAQRSTQAPAQDCGGPNLTPSPRAQPTPTPTPNPEPTPGDGAKDSSLHKLHVTLRPGPKNASKGQVTIAAMLPPIAGFAPAGVPIRVSVEFSSGDWTRALPADCAGAPCLEVNKKGTSYRAQYGAKGPHLSFTRDQKGHWTLHYWSRGETLGDIAPGSVTTTIEIGDLVISGAGQGKIQEDKLVAQ